ncbi:hypothetical protein HKD37_01G001605 [Glycine soja]
MAVLLLGLANGTPSLLFVSCCFLANDTPSVLLSDQPRDLITNLCIHPSPPTRCRHSSSPCQSVTKSRQPAVQIPSSLSKLASCVTVKEQVVNPSWQVAPRRDAEGFSKEEEEGICYFDHADDTCHIML